MRCSLRAGDDAADCAIECIAQAQILARRGARGQNLKMRNSGGAVFQGNRLLKARNDFGHADLQSIGRLRCHGLDEALVRGCILILVENESDIVAVPR
jgi:hypothetical protein